MTEDEVTNFRVKVEKHMDKYADNSHAHMVWVDLDDALENLLDFMDSSIARRKR